VLDGDGRRVGVREEREVPRAVPLLPGGPATRLPGTHSQTPPSTPESRKGSPKVKIPQGSGFPKWRPAQVPVLNEFTLSNTLAWLEVTQRQISSQSPSDATRFWWHLYGI
jgi:hypothetical protein